MWYVYGHFLPNEQHPFYIGVGKDNRAWRVSGRNRYWNRILAKNNCRGEEFCSTKEAAEFYNIGRTSIKNALNGNSKTSGRYTDGTRITWKFIRESCNAVAKW